jgi:chromosome segregation ATPase
MSHKDHTERLILEKSRRLQILKEKAARLGINTPPEILTEIEDIEVELKELQAELEDLKPSETEAISSPIGDG